MLYDIICPKCGQRYGPNSVVFRHNRDSLNALGFGQDYYLDQDWYISYFNGTHENKEEDRNLMKVVDPAFVAESNCHYQDGLLVGVRSSAGYELSERLCPFCHCALHRSAGRLPLQQMAIIGYTNAGKSTYEAALLRQFHDNGIGLVTETLDKKGRIDNTLMENLHYLEGSVLGDAPLGNTGNFNGPYIYQFAHSSLAQPFALAFYDLPGEAFRNRPLDVVSNAPYIGTAQTCLMLLDLKDLPNIHFVFDTLLTYFQQQLITNRANIALVLYKADQLHEVIASNRLPPMMNVRAGKPVDFNEVDIKSQQILKFIVYQNPDLQAAYHTITGALGNDNVRFFLAQAYDSEGKFNPSGCDVPLLWSLARQGVYPHT